MSTEAKRKPTVYRGAAERYFLRTGKPFEWAVILVAEAGGVLSIISDWGSWSHHWPNHGDPSFKHFLVRMGTGHPDYLIRKLGGSKKDFDYDASVVALKRLIGKVYRDRRKLHYAGGRVEVFDKAKAQEALEELRWLDQTNSADDFAREVYERFDFVDSDDIEEVVIKRDSGALLGFLENIWPVFIRQLRAEAEGDYQI